MQYIIHLFGLLVTLVIARQVQKTVVGWKSQLRLDFYYKINTFMMYVISGVDPDIRISSPRIEKFKRHVWKKVLPVFDYNKEIENFCEKLWKEAQRMQCEKARGLLPNLSTEIWISTTQNEFTQLFKKNF
jgi:hypothetical protein